MRETCIWKIPWRRERLPTPVFWPGKFHRLYSGWGRKELDMTEQLSLCPRNSQESSPAPQFKSLNSLALSFLYSPTLTSVHDYWKTIALTKWTFVGKVMSLLFHMLSRLVHTVKGFGTVKKAEVDDFLELSCFFDDPVDIGNWSLVPLALLNPAWICGSSWFTCCWSLAWRIFSITLLVSEMSAVARRLSILWHCLSLGLEWKLTFSSPVATAELSNLLTYWVHNFYSIIF